MKKYVRKEEEEEYIFNQGEPNTRNRKMKEKR